MPNFEGLSDFLLEIMEDGGVDRTVINCWQHQMADFPPLLTILVFDL